MCISMTDASDADLAAIATQFAPEEGGAPESAVPTTPSGSAIGGHSPPHA